MFAVVPVLTRLRPGFRATSGVLTTVVLIQVRRLQVEKAIRDAAGLKPYWDDVSIILKFLLLQLQGSGDFLLQVPAFRN